MRALARVRISLRRLSHGSHPTPGSLVTECTPHLGFSENELLLRSGPGHTETRGLPHGVPSSPQEVQYHTGARAPCPARFASCQAVKTPWSGSLG
jgi:hypothetical protein